MIRRLGFDAGWLVDGNPSGRRWTRSVLHELLRTRVADWQPVVFTPARHHDTARHELGTGVAIQRVLSRPRMLAASFELGLRSRRRCDAVLTQSVPATTFSGPSIVVVHDVLYESHPELFSRTERAYFRARRPLMRFADQVVVVSEATRRALIEFEHVHDESSVHVVPNGVDDRFFSVTPQARVAVRERFGLPDRFALHLGRLNRRKGLATLLNAQTCPGWPKWLPLVVAGSPDGRWSPQDELQLRAAVGRGAAIRLGYVPDEFIPALLAEASILCSASQAEGFGLPPLEAMAAGTHPVVSDIDAHQEVCSDHASFAPVGDASSWAEAVAAGLSVDAGALDEAAAHARTFTWNRTARAILNIADACLGQDSA